jgi:hypothetical protein
LWRNRVAYAERLAQPPHHEVTDASDTHGGHTCRSLGATTKGENERKRAEGERRDREAETMVELKHKRSVTVWRHAQSRAYIWLYQSIQLR